jgi:phenylpropionate dioxygenase-like ring-hydroxylating dioxygenase large terminal subunit
MVNVNRVKAEPGSTAAKAAEPDLGAALIPRDRYTSKEFMDQEWSRMWTKTWMVGCREEEIPEVGDYITTRIGTESLLIVRGEDGKCRVLFNVCHHRGNRVKFDTAGNCATLRCAYHSWEYDLTGKLTNLPDIEGFPQGCPADQLSMTEVTSESWGGWVWYNLDTDCQPLADYLGVIQNHLDPYHFENSHLSQSLTVEWDCNWKTSVDAFNEVYHVHSIHPELLFNNDDVDVQIDLYERHSRYLVPYQTPSPRLGDIKEVPSIISDYMDSIGMSHKEFEGRVPEIREAISVFKRAHQEALGYDYSELNDDQVVDDYHYYIFPNITMNVFAEWMLFFRQRPHESDPNKMYFDIQWLQQPNTEEPKSELPGHVQFKHGEQSLGLVLDQDSVNLPHVQEGMNSMCYKGLWISHQERRIRHMHEALMGYLDPK